MQEFRHNTGLLQFILFDTGANKTSDFWRRLLTRMDATPFATVKKDGTVLTITARERELPPSKYSIYRKQLAKKRTLRGTFFLNVISSQKCFENLFGTDSVKTFIF
jgi:hypothetical protein